MLIQIHIIQNHSPCNLNRDDLGAPKTCYFGGVLRARISSQCLKRSIRLSEYFKDLNGGIRTRRLAELIEKQLPNQKDVKKRVAKILGSIGIKTNDEGRSDMLVYTTKESIKKMAELMSRETDEKVLIEDFKKLIAENTAVPDMALTGRMLETGEIPNTTVEAALQVSHAISTHSITPEVDYYVAADDIPGEDAGAGYLDETLFNSACFYKYFSINWEQLLKNLDGFQGDKVKLAAHTVGAFLKAAALVSPTGKQNSFAAHNPPEAILVEIRNEPINYANAFADPAQPNGERDLIEQSIVQLAQYVYDIDVGYLKPQKRYWFSPNLRRKLSVTTKDNKELELADVNVPSIEELLDKVISGIDPALNWQSVQQVKLTDTSVL